MQKSLLAAILLCWLRSCDGFVPNSARANVRPRVVAGLPQYYVPKEKIPTDSSMDFNEKSEADYLLDYVESEVISDEFIAAATTSPTASKEATELLLESISNTSPDEVFDEEAIISSGVVGDLTEELVVKPLSELADFSRDEDVKAVLAASGQAAAEAEASMPPELIKQLEFVASNGTSSMELESVPDILKAAAVVGEAVTSTKVNAPKVSKILMFAIPAIGVWLCGPLLSLIDTSAVGLLSGTVQQAALNPAVAVTDYAALLIAFLYTGATNLVAAAQEADRGTPNKPRTTKVLVGSMQLSTYVGTALGTILFVFARPLLKAIIGNDGISPAVFAAAMKYVRIRALGMPAAAIIGSTQSACLGMQDIRSPLYVLLAAAVVNFFGDMIFVGSSHPIIGGAAGAAWATVFSQYAGVFFFVKWLTHKSKSQPRVVNVSNAILELTGKSSKGTSRRQQLRDALQHFGQKTSDDSKPSTGMLKKIFKRPQKPKATKAAPKEDSFSVKGFLADRFKFRDLVKFPSAETRKDFTPYLAPVTATQVGRVSGYVAMSHVVASSLGTVSMAAQQVIVSLFYCLCPVADSLSLTAQSFLPSIAAKKPSKERSAALRKAAVNFAKAGAIFGGAMVTAVATIPFISGMFTSDPAVIALVNSVVPLLLAFFSVHGVLCATEGVLLGQTDLNFLGRMYGFYFAAVPFFMLKVKKAALMGTRAVGLTSVWQVMLGYQMFRLTAWLSRVVILQRRTEADEEATRATEPSR